MKILGIDPGRNGYFVLLDNKEFVNSWPMPMVTVGKKNKRAYDLQGIRRIIRGTNPDFVYVEKQQAMPGQGGVSMYSVGYGFGILEGILVGLSMSYAVVRPRTWHKVLCRDVAGDSPKAKAFVVANRLFPTVDFRATERCKKAHDGKIDATLIAYYGMLQFTGTPVA